MIVRKLRKEDLFDAGTVSHIAFHMRKEDMEAERKQWEEHPEDEDWGAFTEDGHLMARIINNHMESRFDGHRISNGGIGAVSTLPEYRESGAIREIFASLLPEARKRGEVISTLYPFLHAFYRKFGYETVSPVNVCTMTPAQLEGHRHTGWVRQWKPGDGVTEYTRIYEAFAERYNLSLIRDDEAMKKEEHIYGQFYKDRRFVYLLGDDTGATAYVVFQDEFRPEAAKLAVREAAWIHPAGFRAVLGFLARFTADYGSLEIPVPSDMDLRLYLRNPYNAEIRPRCDYMIRVVNAEKVLSLMKKPREACFVIRVEGDEQIPENNGTWEVDGDHVCATDGEPDLTVSGRALGQMAIGAMDLAGAELREDVKIHGNRELLQQIFIRKPLYIGDHY